MLDATLLEALRTHPGHAPAWHALHDAAPAAQADRARYAQALEQQTAELSSDASALWLRAGLLFMLTHEDRHLLAMAAQLPSLEDDGKLARLAVLRLLFTTYALNKLSGHQETSGLLDRLHWHEHLADAATQLAQSGAWPDRPVITQPHERRVLLLCSELSTLSHPPTRLAWEQARLLKQMGYEVRILSPQETQCPDLALHCGAPITPSLQPRRKSEWQETLGHDLKVWASDPSTPMERRWTELHAQIATFQPGLVLCIGMGSPAQSLLAPLAPVVTLNTIGVPLGGPADVQLLSRPEAWPIPGLALQFAYRSSVEQAVISAEPYEDVQLQVPPGRVKLVTAGIRLQSMFDSAWAQRMLALLQARPDLHWVLVGLNSLPPALEDLKSQISLVPFQSNLGRVLKACDIYVSPDRLGGGLSVATAMACALPTLSLVDSDGGDKLGPFALATPEAYFDRLDALSQDLSQRLTLGNALRQRYLEELDIARAGPRLVQALDAAQAGFRARTSTPSS